MPKKIIFTVSLLLTPVLFSACSDKDKEKARVKTAAVGLPHSAAECPDVAGVYKDENGILEGVIAVAISDDGSKLQFSSKSTNLDGHTFILDGKYHEESENDRALKYTAGCENGTLALVGSIGNGDDKIDMTVNKDKVEITAGKGKGTYKKLLAK